jgi:ribosomal protein S18 acetylase RimI-like enzyme
MITDAKIDIVQADLGNSEHAEQFLQLTSAYMADPMGEGRSWTDEQRSKLLGDIQEHPCALVLFAKDADAYAGICTCFYAYSTFLVKPILNIHDIFVLEDHRGKGVGTRLMSALERIARQEGCGKITLEVRKDNLNARDLYKSQGYTEAPHSMFFWMKYL